MRFRSRRFALAGILALVLLDYGGGSPARAGPHTDTAAAIRAVARAANTLHDYARSGYATIRDFVPHERALRAHVTAAVKAARAADAAAVRAAKAAAPDAAYDGGRAAAREATVFAARAADAAASAAAIAAPIAADIAAVIRARAAHLNDLGIAADGSAEDFANTAEALVRNLNTLADVYRKVHR